MECKIIVPKDSKWAKVLNLTEDTEFANEKTLAEALTLAAKDITIKRNMKDLGGVTKMLTHQISNINGGIQQDATHSSENSNVILPSQMFNAFTFRGYSQKEVNEIYEGIADIAVRGLIGTFFADDRPLTIIKKELLEQGLTQEEAEVEAKKRQNGEEVNFASLMSASINNGDTEAKEKLIKAFREILIKKGQTGDSFGLFKVLTETFDALDMPIDNKHMFNSAVSELSNKFSKEAIKIKFDGQFAVLKPGSGSQQVYEIKGGLLPYKDGMTVKYREVVNTEVVTQNRYLEWAKYNGIDPNSIKPRDLKGQYVDIISPTGEKTQLTFANGDQLIPEAKALANAKLLIEEYKAKLNTSEDYESLYKSFIKDFKKIPEDDPIKVFFNRYVERFPDPKMVADLKKGDSIGKVFHYLNPEATFFKENLNRVSGNKAKLFFLGRINTLGKLLTHELNEFFSVATKGEIPESIKHMGDAQLQQVDVNAIYNSLPNQTASNNIVINPIYQKNGVDFAKSIDGVFSLRLNHTDKHFGNPFTHDAIIAKKDNLIKTNTTKEAVENYIQWVLKSLDSRAIWIREQLKTGNLKGKKIVYYKELGEASHANALDYLINDFDWDRYNINNFKIETSRAEVIVDLTARDKFMIREGDDISDINQEFFLNRLLEKSNYNGIPYHGAQQLIKSGEQRILFHQGTAPASYDDYMTDRAVWDTQEKQMDVYGTDEGGSANKILFSLKGETSVRIIDGNIHVFMNLPAGTSNFMGPSGNDENLKRAKNNYKTVKSYLNSLYKIKEVDLTRNVEEHSIEEREALNKKATSMFNSWNVYLDVIGTRIPGQHFQSFQGMRIVGFATGNKIFVPNEVTMLAGSDYDIDKVNMIYYSIDEKTNLLAKWHPSFDYSTKEALDLSMKLPLPTGRTAFDFKSEIIDGFPIDKVVTLYPGFNINNIKDLVWLYEKIKDGYLLDDSEKHNEIANILEQLDSKETFKVGAKGINNFTISRANAVINNPRNYLLLQQPVSMAAPQLMGEMSKEGVEAKLRSKEQPSSIVFGKIDNMVGQDMIGITASSGLKALSGMTAVYNKSLMELGRLSDKLAILDNLTPTSEQGRTQINNRRASINQEIKTIKDGFPKDFSLANINYENAEASVLNLIAPRFKVNAENANSYTPSELFAIQNMMEGLADDAADVDSQLLSAATDNAKELILSKIKAIPDFGGIYVTLISRGVPFWSIVEIMTKPSSDFYIKHFGKEPFQKVWQNFDLVLAKGLEITDLETINKRKTFTGEDAFLFKEAKKEFADLGWSINDDLLVHQSGDSVKLNELVTLNEYLKQGAEMQMLGKYLGINQGIKAKAYDLYSFTKTIETHLYDAYKMSFSFARFLNSLNEDKSYANEKIAQLNLKTTSNFNLLYVLANATNFQKQLQGFNVANEMLIDTTYKMNAAYNISKRLEQYTIRKNGKINEEQFNEVQNFIDNTVLLQFFNEETARNSDPLTRPVFYDNDTRIELTTAKGRNDFMVWVHDKFLPKLKNAEAFENNEFVRDLSYDTVRDSLYSEPVEIIRMTYDTTNALSQESRGREDNYKVNLNKLKFGYDKDSNLPNTNNIFNVLFWYNTLVNKGGTGKYSWAKIQNELIINDVNHPFTRLAELQGRLGKGTNVVFEDSLEDIDSKLIVNGISFNLKNLLVFHPFYKEGYYNPITEEQQAAREAREAEFDSPDSMDPSDMEDGQEEWDYDPEMEMLEGGNASNYLAPLRTFKINRRGKVGTTVNLKRGNVIVKTIIVTTPLLSIPYDINPDPKLADSEPKISPADSARALREIGERFRLLNPNIDIQFRNPKQIMELSDDHKFNFSVHRAFILNGQININLNKASISDVIHEYGHIFLHNLKYDSKELYDNLIQLAANHPRYSEIRKFYPELQIEDMNEEVFITLFGEEMRSNLLNLKPKVLSKLDFAKRQIEEGQIRWDGDKGSPRPVLGIEWIDIRKGQTDILADKNSAAAKKLIDAIDKARKQGGYDFIQGSGKITQKMFVPINEEIVENDQEVDNNKELMLNFADYTKTKLNAILNKEVDSVFDLSPQDVMALSLEDAINLVGDDVMKNRIDNIYERPAGSLVEIDLLKKDLIDKKLIIEHCG